MKIGFNRLCEYFTEKTKKVYCHVDSDTYFVDAELMTSKKLTYTKEYIYIGKTSMFNGNLMAISNTCFILQNDDSVVFENYHENNLRIIEINDDEDIFEIYNEVRAFFRMSEKYIHFKMSLLEVIASGGNLEKLINTASKLMGNPLIVVDLSYKVLANSPEENITDFLWFDNVKNGYCSYDLIAELRKLEPLLKEVRKSNKPYEVTCDLSPIKKLICKIKIEGKTIGHILLFECEKQISSKDHDYLMLLRDILAKELDKKQFYRHTKNILSEEILYDILENNITDKAIIKERLANASFIFYKHISVGVIDISKFEVKQYVYMNNWNSHLSNLFPKGISIYYNDHIVLLYHYDNFSDKENRIGKAKDFLLRNNLKMGISCDFSSLADCNYYYQQAKRSLEIGEIIAPKNCVYHYEDIQPYNYIYMLKDKMSKEDFYNDSLHLLKEYDEQNGSDLYNTLYLYLKNNHNITSTSEEMFIHRNTLRYRIEKIIEIIRLDLDENENSYKLYYAFKSLDFYEKIIEIQRKENQYKNE